MSQPEWIKKYQQIGQKGPEAVTSVDEHGSIAQTADATQEIDPRRQRPAPEEEEEDAAALFHAAGAAPVAAQEEENRMISSVHSTDDAAAMFHAAAAQAAVQEETEPESDAVAGSTPDAGPAVVAAEDIGESWVVDKDMIQEEQAGDDHLQFDEEVMDDLMGAEYAQRSGNSFEEVEIDEDGNEVYYEHEDDEVIEDEEEIEENTESSEEEEVVIDEFDENQQQQARTAFAVSNHSRSAKVAPAPQDDAPKYDIEEQRRVIKGSAIERRSHMSPIVPIMSFLIIVAAVMLVSFLVIAEERDSRLNGPTQAPTMQFPPLEPTNNGNVAAAATTRFDPFQNDCNFDNLEQPNFIDQCACGSRITTVADDVRARWDDLRNDFIPTVFRNWDERISSCSAENQALLWMSSGINNGGEVGNTLMLQRYSLALLYIQQQGTQWTRSTNWMSERDACEWEGVTCTSQSYIQVLNLDGNRLGGRISDAVTLLNAIEEYSAAQNEMFGQIPRTFFRGGNLRELNLSFNFISGRIPDGNERSQLRALNLEGNRLDGSIPSTMGEFENLESLNLAQNRLTGLLPRQLFDLPLTELTVGGNSLDGTFPAEMTKATTLTGLLLGPNLFNTTIPTFFGELTNLKRLSMAVIPELKGRIPAEIGISLTKLEELTITETSVTGNIPDQISQLTDLQTLNLSSNSLARAIPDSLGLLTKLVTLVLNDNELTGTVPSSLGSMILLQTLELHTNQLDGPIPPEFGGLLSLQTLTLDGNFMSGRAPQSVCALRDAQLEEFFVDCPSGSGGQLEGIICSIPDCCTECL